MDDGDASLRFPVVDAVIEVGIELVFVLEYGSLTDGGDGEFYLHIILVEPFFEDEVALHLGADYLAVFEVVGGSVELGDVFFHGAAPSFFRIIRYDDVRIRRTFGFQYLYFYLISVHEPEVIVQQVVAGVVFGVQYDGGCGGVRCVGGHLQLFHGGLAVFHTGVDDVCGCLLRVNGRQELE